MTPERWERIEAIFATAIGLAEPARAAYLRDACADDPGLADEIVALLDGGERASATLEAVVGFGAAALCAPATSTRIGPYRVLELLGTGGMGSVYLAERDDGEFRRRVAIKVLRAGLASPELVARFRNERQVLAALEHPGIVRFIDGGTTDDGAPYLVMEYVEGSAFTDHARQLPIRARIALVIQIADALQGAHQRLVVHRDIKPGNLRVDTHGRPRVLDFGIAKLLDPEHDSAVETRTGATVFTTAYASPEQLRREPISVATDIYSLGAVLYEVLVGKPPRPDDCSPHEMLEIVRELPPTRPSLTAPALRRELAGDLDNIVLKALAPNPNQRYASMADFADDLRAYLDGRPVRARAATLRYRMVKGLQRHRGKVMLATAVVASLATATAISLVQAHRADQESRRVEEQREILLVQRARQELAAGRSGRALPFLAEALRAGGDTPATRFLIATAMRPYEHRVAHFHHPAGATAAVWSPDGARIAISSMVSRGELRAADGSLRARFEGEGSFQDTPAFSRDGRRLATLDGLGRIGVWDVATGARQFSLPAHESVLPNDTFRDQDVLRGGVAFFDDDRRLLSGGGDHRLAIWELASRTRQLSVETDGAITTFAISPDEAMIASATEHGTLALWDANLGSRGTLGTANYVSMLAFSPDGARLYAADAVDGVGIWDLARRTHAVVPGSMFALDPTRDHLATAGLDGVVRIWSARTPTLERELVGHERRPIRDIQWSRDGAHLATAGIDGTFRIWDATTGVALLVIEAPAGVGDAPHALAGALSASFSPDGTKVLTLSGIDGALWRVDRGALLDELDAGAVLYAAAWSPDERAVVTAGLGGAAIWRDGRRDATSAAERIFDASWSPDGTRVAFAGQGHIARVMNADDGRVVELAGHTGEVYRATFSPDGGAIATASADHTARIWDAVTRTERRRFAHPSAVTAAAWSRDGLRVVTAGADGHLRIWSTLNGALEVDLDGGARHYLDASFSPDGRAIVAASAGSEVEIWDVTTRARRLALEGHSANVTTATFDPDGALIATSSSDHTVRVWDSATGDLLASFAHPGEVLSVQWSRDGARLLSGCADGRARTWDVRRSHVTVAALDAFIAERVPYKLTNGRLEHAEVQ